MRAQISHLEMVRGLKQIALYLQVRRVVDLEGAGVALDAAIERLEVTLPNDAAKLCRYVEWHGPIHADGCSEDSTCDCEWKAVLDGVNRLCRLSNGRPALEAQP